IHVIVRDLASRLGDEFRSDKQVIKQCGHVLAEVCYGQDKNAGGHLIREQLTLLAEAYVERHLDMLGLCWLGEMACWNDDEELAQRVAGQVWELSEVSAVQIVSEIVAFFALTSEYSGGWERIWVYPESPRYHFGEMTGCWNVEEETLTAAVVNRAFNQG